MNPHEIHLPSAPFDILDVRVARELNFTVACLKLSTCLMYEVKRGGSFFLRKGRSINCALSGSAAGFSELFFGFSPAESNKLGSGKLKIQRVSPRMMQFCFICSRHVHRKIFSSSHSGLKFSFSHFSFFTSFKLHDGDGQTAIFDYKSRSKSSLSASLEKASESEKSKSSLRLLRQQGCWYSSESLQCSYSSL